MRLPLPWALRAALAILGAGLAAACTTPEPAAGPAAGPSPGPSTNPASGPASVEVRAEEVRPVVTLLGRSLEDRPIDLWTFGNGPDTVLVLATIHGNEGAGTPLLDGLSAHLRRNPGLLAGRTVLLIPVANPDGFERGSRGNARGVDLNRNFPADNFRRGGGHGSAPLSEPESRALHGLLEQRRPNRIVSIHQPLSCVDYDGPADALAAAVAAAGDLPVRRIGSRPGSLGSYAGITLGIPIVTLELPRAADMLESAGLWEHYGPMLVAAITFAPGAADTAPGSL